MSIEMLLLIVVIVLLFSGGGYYGFGHIGGGVGLLGACLIIFLVLLLLGRLG